MKMRNMLAMVAVVLLVVFMVEVNAAYKSTWTYQPGDLSGANCIQTAVDTIWDLLHGTGTATNANLVVTTSITKAGREVVTAPSTTGYMIERGTCNAASQLEATTVTQSFTTVFTVAPIVIALNAASVGSKTNYVAPTVTLSNFTYVVAATNTTLEYLAVGAK